MYSAIGQEDACRELNLPADRVGDIIVLGDQHTVLGKSPKDHDLTQVWSGPAQSHTAVQIIIWTTIITIPLYTLYMALIHL